MSVITTGNISRALELGVKKVYGDEYNMQPMLWKQVFDDAKSSKAYETFLQWEDFGLAPVKPEGQGTQYDSAAEGFIPKFQNITYSLGFIVSMEAKMDNQYNLFARGARKLAKSMAQTQETVGFNILNYAFTAGKIMPGGDGQELCSVDHIRGPSDSTTYSNMLATPAAFSETSLEELLIQIRNAVDSRGLRIGLMAEKLIGGAALEFEFERVLNTTLRPGTANNDINASKSLGKLPGGAITSPFITSTTAWFIKTNADSGLMHMDRMPMEFAQDLDFGTSDTRFKATYRDSFGWVDPRGIYGTAGA